MITLLWVIGIVGAAAISVLVGLAIYLARRSRRFEVEFRALWLVIRIRSERD